MAARSGAMHVARNKRAYVAKSGEQRVYESVLVRRTYREAGKVRHETLANLSALPEQAIAAVEAALRGEPLVPAARALAIASSLPHGHVAAVHAMARKLGLPGLLGPAGPQRDLALALVVSRVVAPASKLSTLSWWDDTTLGADLGVADAAAGDIYAAMDWLAARRGSPPTRATSMTTRKPSSRRPQRAARTWMPSPGTSPSSPRSSPAATATASMTGSPRSRPTTSLTCTPSSAASRATTKPCSTASPCRGAQASSRATSTGPFCGMLLRRSPQNLCYVEILAGEGRPSADLAFRARIPRN